ncbi:MAG: TIGR03086 family metal-binding protein [Acidimicrobiales bacterium]
MSEVGERYGRIAQGFEQRLDGVGPGELDRPTPCDEWQVRQLVGHVIDTHRWVVARLDGSEAEPFDTSADLGAGWRAARQSVSEALDDPVRAGQTTSGLFGEQSFESLVSRLLCADTLIHTWDLARATGQDETLDAEGVATAAEFLLPHDEQLRRPGGFAPKIEPPAGADAQTRLLCFAGRTL